MNLYGFLDSDPVGYIDLLGHEKLRPSGVPPQEIQLEPEVTDPQGSAATCGDLNFVIHWKLTSDAHKRLGGYIVQKYTANWHISECDGDPPKKDLSIQGPQIKSRATGDSFKSPFSYWEAWRVKPGRRGGQGIEPVDTDSFEWNTNAFSRDLGKTDKPNWKPYGHSDNCGWVEIEGVAVYYDGIAALPASMVTRNHATWAGDVPSSTTEPMLRGKEGDPDPVKSKEFRHWIKFHWNCCSGSKNKKTIIEDWGPKP